MVRKLLMIGGAIVLVCGLLIYSILAGLILGSVRDAAVQAILRAVSNTMQGSLEVGSVRGSLLSTPVLQDIVLKDAQGDAIAHIDALRLSYRLWSLLRLRLTVHEIEIVQPRATLVEERDGVLNISRALAPVQPRRPRTPRDGFGPPVDIVVENLQLRDGEATLSLSALPGVRQVTGLQLRAQAEMDAQGLQARLLQLTAATSPAQVDIRARHGAFQWIAGVMRVDDLRLGVGHTVLTADGALPHGQHPADFTLRIDPLDVAEIGRLLQQDILHGQLRLSLRVEGPPEALVAHVDLNPLGEDTTGAVAVRGEVNAQAMPLRYRAQVDIGHLDLTAVLNQPAWKSDVNLQVHVEGVGLAPRELESTVRVDIHPSRLGNIILEPSQIVLQAQQGRFQVQRFEVQTSLARLSATGAVDLVGRSNLDYEVTAQLEHLRQLLDEVRLDGDVHLQGQATGDWPHLTIRGSLDVREVQYQEYALDELRLTYEGAELGVSPRLTTALRLQRARLGAVPVAQVELHGTYDGPARQVQFTLEVDQAPGNGMNTRGSLTLLEAGQRVDIEALRLQVAERLWQATGPLQVIHEGDRLQWTPLHLVHGEESVEISGGITGEQLQDIRVQASHLDLSLIQNLIATHEPLHGRANMQVLLSGTLPTPLLQLELSIQPEGRRTLPFQSVQASLAYSQQLLQGQVRIQQLDREVLAVDLRLPADLALIAIPLDQRLVEGPIALNVHLLQPDLEAFTRWYQGLPQLTGTLQGTLGVQGTAAQLSLMTDLHLQKLGLQGTAEHLEGTISMTGQMVAAPSTQDLQHAIRSGELTLAVDTLMLRATMQGQLPTQEGPAQSFDLRDVVVQANGRWSPQGVHATLQTLQLQAQAFGLPPTNLFLEGSVTPERLDLQRLQVRLPQSEVRGQGTLTMADQNLEIRLEIPHLQLDEFPLTLPPDLPTQVQGVITAHGSLHAPQAEVRLTYAGAQIAADLETELQEALPRYQARLRIDTLNVARLSPQMAGELQAMLQLQGSGFTAEQRRISLDLSVDSRNFTLAPGLTVRAQGELAEDTVNVQAFRVSSTPVQLTASGMLSATQEAGVSYALTLGDLSSLQQVLGAVVQASGTLTGKIQGPLSALQTIGALRLKNWRYAEISGGPVEADFSAAGLPSAPQGSVQVQVADVQAPSLPDTSLRLGANYALAQGRVTATVTKGPYERTTLAGRVALNDSQQLTLDRLRLHLRDLAWENDGPVEVVRSTQGDVEIRRFNLRSGTQRLSVTGTLGQSGVLAADVRVQQVEIGPNVRAVQPDIAVPEGRISLDLALGGSLQQPQGQGALQLTSLTWQQHDLGEMRAAVDLADQTARTDLRWTAQGRELLQVQGAVGLSANGVLALQVRAPDLPLNMWQGMVPGVTHSSGVLNLDLRADGTLQQPRLNGSLRLDDGALQLAATGERYQDIRMRIAVAGERIDIQQLYVGSQSGPLEVQGWAQVAGLTLRQVDITVQAREFTAMNTPGIQAVTSIDLAVRGSLEAMAATGTVSMTRVRVQVNNVPGTGPKVVQPWELTVEGVYGPGPKPVAPGDDPADRPIQIDMPLPFLRADIQVDIPRNAWVQAPGTAIELSGGLHITKAREQPFVLSGEITIMRGFASLYGKRFVIREGQVIFTGSPDIDPQLDITVTHTVSNYLVEIDVGGRARRPEITFSSTPELPQTDILSLLIVGKTMDRLTSSEQQDLSSQLGGAAGSIIAGQLQEVLGGALGLDTLTIGAGENFGSSSVSIGQYVTQDIFLSYEVGIGKGGGNRVGVEYSITPRLKLKASTRDDGASAVDFLWRRDY